MDAIGRMISRDRAMASHVSACGPFSLTIEILPASVRTSFPVHEPVRPGSARPPARCVTIVGCEREAVREYRAQTVAVAPMFVNDGRWRRELASEASMLRVVVGFVLLAATAANVSAQCGVVVNPNCSVFQLGAGAYTSMGTARRSGLGVDSAIQRRTIRRAVVNTWSYTEDKITAPRADLRRPNPVSKRARTRFRALRVAGRLRRFGSARLSQRAGSSPWRLSSPVVLRETATVA